MIWLIIAACVIAFIAFLLTRYAGIIIKYRDDFTVSVTYGILKFNPGKKKRIKKPKKKKEAPEAEIKEEEKPKEKTKITKDAIFEVLEELKDLLPKFIGKIHFRSAKLEVKTATGDAASTALQCAGAKAGVSLIFETIDRFAVLEKGSEKNVSIEPDFLSDKPSYDIDLRFRIRVIYAVHYGIKTLVRFMKIKIKKEKSNKETKKRGHKNERQQNG
ncbi:MAG: DUF2953 domain-containing protein [Clostridia bacterium]|nr:DUF2953 domain-containing protein [Clostridia bacterium]